MDSEGKLEKIPAEGSQGTLGKKPQVKVPFTKKINGKKVRTFS